MALIKWEPLREIEDLFGHSLAWPLGRAQSMLGLGDWNPRVDISKSNGSYIIKADVPGVAKEDLKVTAQEGQLVVSVPRKAVAPSAEAVQVPIE